MSVVVDHDAERVEHERLAELGRTLLQLRRDKGPRALQTLLESLDEPLVADAEAAIAIAEREVMIGVEAAAEWRAHPAVMANHLTGGERELYPYVMLLSLAFRDAIMGIHPKQIWMLPSQYGKTTDLLDGVIWALDYNPRLRIMYVTYDDDKAKEEGGKARDFAEAHAGVLRFELRRDRRARGMWRTPQGGGLYAVGVYGGITGWPADVVLCDDLFKGWQTAHSETERNSVWNVYTSQVRMRVQNENSPIIVAGTRWHEDDVPARLRKKQDDPDGDEFHVIRLPAIAEEPDPKATDPLLREPDPLGREPGEVLEPRRFSEREVRARAATLGSYLACTPAETPILMADWSTRAIVDVREGDEIVGFTNESGRKMRLHPTRVQRVASIESIVLDYHMASGRVVRATLDHRWFVRAGRPYQMAREGTPLRHVCEIDDEPSSELIAAWNYLAGIIDGEGHIRRNSLTITQTHANADVIKRIIETLDVLGLTYSVHEHETRDGWSDRVDVQILHAGRVLRTLLRHTRLAKRESAIAALYEGSGRVERSQDRVVRIDNPRRERVYALQTESGNYVAWGYASSNSAVEQQRPAPAAGTEILREWWRFESALPEQFDEMITSWDMKLKDKESGDYVVGQTWGRNAGHYWLTKQLRGQWNQPTTENAIALASVREPRARVHLVENTGNGPEVIAALRKPHPEYVVSDHIAGLLGMTTEERVEVQRIRRQGMSSIIPVTVKGDKVIRMRAESGAIEGGETHLPENAEWLITYIEEMSAFPNGAHDDQVDATSQALSYLRRGGGEMATPKGEVRQASAAERQSSPAQAGVARAAFIDPRRRLMPPGANGRRLP